MENLDPNLHNPRICVLVTKTVDGYAVAYVFDWAEQKKFYNRNDLKAMWKTVKEFAKRDYGYHNATIGSGVVVNLTEETILEKHKAKAADSYDLSYQKQFSESF